MEETLFKAFSIRNGYLRRSERSRRLTHAGNELAWSS
jgi:hypothetical protein